MKVDQILAILASLATILSLVFQIIDRFSPITSSQQVFYFLGGVATLFLLVLVIMIAVRIIKIARHFAVWTVCLFILLFISIILWLNPPVVNIEGTVIDANDSTYIRNVYVYIKGTNVVDTTGNNGKFSLQVKRMHKYKVVAEKSDYFLSENSIIPKSRKDLANILIGITKIPSPQVRILRIGGQNYTSYMQVKQMVTIEGTLSNVKKDSYYVMILSNSVDAESLFVPYRGTQPPGQPKYTDAIYVKKDFTTNLAEYLWKENVVYIGGLFDINKIFQIYVISTSQEALNSLHAYAYAPGRNGNVTLDEIKRVIPEPILSEVYWVKRK